MTYAEALLEALAQSGRSGRDVSMDAVGHESAIRSLKRGLDLRVSTIQALCRVLGLEFYVGPPREAGDSPARSGVDLPLDLPQQGGSALGSADVVREAGLSRADRHLLRSIEDVLAALDDLDFRATLASLTRFAHKHAASGQGAGGSVETEDK